MKKLVLLVVTGILMLCARPANAAIIELEAFLAGSNEVPPNVSPATGFGTVFLDDVLDTITVDLSWSGLLGPATAAHIHTGPLGVSGPVTFPFSGVPSTTSGTIATQVFAITPAQIVTLETGGMYMNVHSNVIPGGEIRGQLAEVAPEPGSATLLLAGAIAGLLLIRRRAVRT